MTTKLELRNTTSTFKKLANQLDDHIEFLRLEDVKIEGSEEDMIFYLARTVRGHPSLREVYIKNVTTNDHSISLDLVVSSILVSVDNIESLHIENTPVKASAVATVAYCSSLKYLSLPNNRYTDEDAKVIADGLSSNKSVEMVDLSRNILSDKGGRQLVLCLEKNTSLRTFKLDGNRKLSGDICAKIQAKLVGRTV